ncbi:MAG: hypothetical protein ABIQ98_03615 [Sphingomicrobium sp.]
MTTESQTTQSQADKFRAAAKRIGCDEDEARWTDRLKKVAKVKLEKPE